MVVLLLVVVLVLVVLLLLLLVVLVVLLLLLLLLLVLVVVGVVVLVLGGRLGLAGRAPSCKWCSRVRWLVRAQARTHSHGSRGSGLHVRGTIP